MNHWYAAWLDVWYVLHWILPGVNAVLAWELMKSEWDNPEGHGPHMVFVIILLGALYYWFLYDLRSWQ